MPNNKTSDLDMKPVSFFKAALPSLAINTASAFIFAFGVMSINNSNSLRGLGDTILSVIAAAFVSIFVFLALLVLYYFRRPEKIQPFFPESQFPSVILAVAAGWTVIKLLAFAFLPFGTMSFWHFIEFLVLWLICLYRPRYGMALFVVYVLISPIVVAGLGGSGSIGMIYAFVFYYCARSLFADSAVNEGGLQAQVYPNSAGGLSLEIGAHGKGPSVTTTTPATPLLPIEANSAAPKEAKNTGGRISNDPRSKDESPSSDIDRWAYSKVSQELGLGERDPADWMKAYSEAMGDEAKAKAIYIRLRAETLGREERERRAKRHAEHQVAAAAVASELASLKDAELAACRFGTFGHLVEAANSPGGADAQFYLGLMYTLGYLVERNILQGRKWMAAAADGRNKQAQQAIGWLDVDKEVASLDALGAILRMAVKAGDELTVQMIAEKFGRAINQPDDLGFTAMHAVANTDSQRIASILLKFGGNADKKHNFGKSAREIAAQRGVRIFAEGKA